MVKYQISNLEDACGFNAHTFTATNCQQIELIYICVRQTWVYYNYNYMLCRVVSRSVSETFVVGVLSNANISEFLNSYVSVKMKILVTAELVVEGIIFLVWDVVF